MAEAAADLIRNARVRHGLSQRRLALRAGTSQDAISRIERGAESPTLRRLSEVLLVMGERPALASEPLEGAVDRDGLSASSALSPEERLLESASWNLVATRLESAGAAARKVAHPATRRTRQ